MNFIKHKAGISPYGTPVHAGQLTRISGKIKLIKKKNQPTSEEINLYFNPLHIDKI